MMPLGNEFVRGGLVLMLTGAAMGLLRKVPETFYAWLKHRFSVSLMILEIDPLFEWTKIWLDTLPYSRRSRSISCSLYRESDQDFTTDSRAIFAPAYGSHFFRHKGRFIWLARNKTENQPTHGMATTGSKSPESITLTILGTDQKVARELVQEIMEAARVFEQQAVRGYISGVGWWRRLYTFKPRRLETVDVPRDDEVRITANITEFLSSRSVYTKRGIPYHLNFLFAGLPGTGKTSLASALCGHFGLNLYILNIAGPGMNDDRLVELMLTLPRKSMLLLEDVDAVVPEARRKPKSSVNQAGLGESEAEGITLSGLLNCMDGLTAPEGVVIVMTTNHPELLDSALIRPGRVDMRVNFGAATREQIERMCRRLVPNQKMNGQVESMLMQNYTTAQVQSALLTKEPQEDLWQQQRRA
jgi:chaperone BCS1